MEERCPLSPVEIETLDRYMHHITEYVTQSRDYGNGELLTMVEIHTLTLIAQSPGLRITDAAQQLERTLGAVSRNVDRLQRKGYLEKRKLPGNQKNICLFPTPTGEALAEAHLAFDQNYIRSTGQHILSRHTEEELHTFFAVLRTLNETF